MKLIVLTRASFFVEENIILTALFEEGLDYLHLYKPNTEPIYSERLLALLSNNYLKHITVHDHFYLKEEYNLRGIHLNDYDAAAPQGYHGNISRTCHRLSELQTTKKHSDYVFLKSLFDSQTNPEDKQNLTIEEMETAAQQGLIDRKVFAMGGMNLDNLHIAKEIGFGGVVICGDLWNRFNIHNEIDFKALLQHFIKLRKATA